MICKKCGKEKEELFFKDQNGISAICNECKPKTKPVVVVPEKVSDKPVSVKTTKK